MTHGNGMQGERGLRACVEAALKLLGAPELTLPAGTALRLALLALAGQLASPGGAAEYQRGRRGNKAPEVPPASAAVALALLRLLALAPHIEPYVAFFNSPSPFSMCFSCVCFVCHASHPYV